MRRPAPSEPADETVPSAKDRMEQALFGQDATQRIVAVETDTDPGETAVLFLRQKNGTTKQQVVEFRPWIALREERVLPEAEVRQLDGNGYPFLITFASWKAYQNGRRILSTEQRDYLNYGSAVKQYLISTGQTLFKGMAFPDICRMQIDIETTTLSPQNPEACIFLIVASDNRGNEAVLTGDEREILVELTRLVQKWDPDILEGHNIYAFDLPWIRARAKALGVTLLWGREDERTAERPEVQVGSERNCAIGANSRPFLPHYIWGRHIVDTLFQTQRFDLARGEISSYGLKECAQHYHIAEPNRVYLDRAQILDLYRDDPENVRAYATADVRETRRLAEIVCPTEFYQTQMVPDTYQSVAVTGSGEKINSIFVRAYLHRGCAVARQQAPVPYAGGYTEMLHAGVFRRIVKADVESLYPSIMLLHRITSASDTLDLFLPMLDELKRRRISAKKRAQQAAEGNDARRAAYWDGLQGSYKLLINSFYGYLGAPFYFNDYAAAAKVTEIGQDIVKRIAADLQERSAKVIEIDTDGVYFVPPDAVHGPEQEIAFVETVGKTLEDGIRLAFDGRYDYMLSLKAKNYVLVSYDGKKTFKGSSLRSRADERFGRRFLTQAVDCLLEGDVNGLSGLYADLQAKLERRELGIEEIARRERVTENTFKSDAKKRNAEAMRGLSVGDYAILYQREDKSLALASDYADDEDIEYYQTKLYKFAERLRPAIEGHETIRAGFETLFPKPLTGARRKAKEAAKQQMSLFEM
ncbi:MAG: DNA polymerase domain-containing protein [Capsulimonadales bacterium]|nr:DNA polymerase domain-containing protein [Capsulimonadales bacterium]